MFKTINNNKNKGSNSNKKKSVPWVEKYRPKRLNDVCYQVEAINTLKQVLHTGNLPHLLFYGPPGTGKTSTILALANELFGTSHMKSRILELNASNERGIDVVRYKDIIGVVRTSSRIYGVFLSLNLSFLYYNK